MRIAYVSRVAVVLALMAVPAAAQTFPPAGIDEFNSTLLGELFDDPACSGFSGSIFLDGVAALKRSNAVDPGDSLREVALEMVAMSLGGDGVTLQEAAGGSDPDDAGDPPCLIGGASADGGPGCSPGSAKALQASPDFPAEMTLDLFFELTVGVTTLFNKTGAPIASAAPLNALPLPFGAAVLGDPLACVPLFDTADPFGPAVGSFRTLGFFVGAPTAVPVTALKLALIDQPGATPDKMVFKSKDGQIAPHSLTPDDTTVTLSVAYGSTSGSYTIPPGAFDGVSGWTDQLRFRNTAAPGGVTQIRSARLSPFKLVARGLGDVPIDLLGAGAPAGPVSVIAHLEGDTFRETVCTEFADCTYALLAGGTGAKLKCRNGTPAPTCTPME